MAAHTYMTQLDDIPLCETVFIYYTPLSEHCFVPATMRHLQQCDFSASASRWVFFLLDCSLIQGLRHWETPVSFTKSASYLKILLLFFFFLKFTPWLITLRFIKSILGLKTDFEEIDLVPCLQRVSLAVFICRTCFVPKLQCGLNLCLMDYWSMNRVDWDRMCHQVGDVLPL